MAIVTAQRATHKKFPTLVVGSIETDDWRVDFFKPSKRRRVDISVELNTEKEELLYKASRSVLQAMMRGIPHNCASFSHALAAVPIRDIADSVPSGWEFEGPVQVNKLPDFATGYFMYRTLNPAEQPIGLGHWHTILSRPEGLSVHVDGGGEPIRISPTSSLLATYPPTQFDHYHALPAC